MPLPENNILFYWTAPNPKSFFSKIPESVVYIFFNILMFFPFHKHKRNARRDEL